MTGVQTCALPIYDAWMEHIVDWTVVEDDYLTEFERSQLEYEGKITYPAIEVSFG